MKRFPMAWMAALAWLLGATPAARATAPMVEPDTASVTAPSGPAASWWLGFDEPALDRLQAAARAGSLAWNPAMQAELASAFITLRVQNVRLHTAAALRDTSRQERELIASRSPTRESAKLRAALDERAAGAERAIAAFAQDRDAAIRRVLELTAADADVAKAALREALDDRSLPNFRRSVPQRLPAAVLLTRADVADVERHMAATSSMSMLLSGWIGPAAGPAPLALPGDEGAVGDTVRQAGHEIAWSLRQLIDANRGAVDDARRLDARRLEMMAMQRRAEAGDAHPADELEAYQRFLADADRLAEAQGRLALAWIELQAMAPGAWQPLAARTAP